MAAILQYHTHSSRKAIRKLAWQIFADWAFKFTYQSKPRLNGDKLTIGNLINKPLWYYMDICSLRLYWCCSLKYDAFSRRGFKISAKLQLSLSNVFSIYAKSIGSKQRLSVFTLWGKTGVSTHSCWTVDLPSHQSSRVKRASLCPAAPPPLIKSKSDGETSSVTPGSRTEGGGSSRYVGESWLVKLEPRL